VTATLLALATLLAGQGSGAGTPPQMVPGGDRLAVYLVTFGPGPMLWERFGHNALWIRDIVTGNGQAYDFGRFDFRGERFFLNFAQGRMLYWMGRDDGVALINFYIRMQRSAWLQELALSPRARSRLRDMLETDYQRDLGRYRYDYYRDNCSTRVRDAIDSVVAGAIRGTLDTIPSGTTYRFHTRRSLQHNALEYFGVTASLTAAADRPISAYEEAFLPMQLRDHLRQVQVPGPEGRTVPLVKAEIALSASDLWLVPDSPANWTVRFLLAGLLLAGALLGLGASASTSVWGRRGFYLVAGVWATVAGVAGLVFVFFWTASEHVVAYANQNLWQLNLLSLALLGMLPVAARGDAAAVRMGRVLALTVAVSAVAGLLVKGLPGVGQANGDILAFTLPAQLGLAGGFWLATRPRAPSAAPPGPR
jgi:hypothetical protein